MGRPLLILRPAALTRSLLPHVHLYLAPGAACSNSRVFINRTSSIL